MNVFVGVTENDWSNKGTRQPGIDEVNSWQPGATAQFRALGPG